MSGASSVAVAPPAAVDRTGNLVIADVDGHVTGGPARVISEGHRRTAEHIQICHHAAPGKPVTEAAEGLLDARAVE
ncbi:MAG TPA: hypothetical protein VKS82_19215, partial [Streptosporangiaceae bacterium]|nr:hypothetical protein [Streptosporangiaceae bacterium]